ncbi:phosphatase PAP2 family protein [Sphingomonas sp. LY29]|uniref:phosphatase PAP2 family protein n=1 Tax=Sphingomonas sp. LY29 TaxID=3095341 RepID=UPI002D78BFD8|nr:phosphatase PAP2 family protein [Sphingomonas sp. LY29]WRP26743.1 phosphatase PAP2 family protein [Sphingomonas sp. LY29]
MILQYPLIAFGFPLADGALLNADRMLGFDFAAFVAPFKDARLWEIVSFGYYSMTWQAPLVLIVMCAANYIDRAWHLVTAAMIGLCISAIGLMLFPADGSFVLCGVRPEGLPIVGRACDYSALIRGFHAGELTVIDRSMQLGMISMPSFHTTAAILFVWGLWPIRLLRAPSILLNALMIIGTIVIGSHYLVDTLAGAANAAASILAANKLAPRNGESWCDPLQA